MTSFIAFLEEVEQNHGNVELSSIEVERLVVRFGPAVRSMGHRNANGSIEIPMGNIAEAARMLDDARLSEAVSQLKSPESFADTMEMRSAGRLVDTLSRLYLRQFQTRVERFQQSSDIPETNRLWAEIEHDLFNV